MDNPGQLSIIPPPVRFISGTGKLEGSPVKKNVRYIKDLQGIFKDETARASQSQEEIVYEVEMYMPVKEGTTGSLFFGNTTVFAGKVGDEYYMTRGHFHALPDRTEFYWCIRGEGMLVEMNLKGITWAEEIFPGSLHFIPPRTAHRVVNTGKNKLVLGACWPADAGHNYGDIEKKGFGARVMEINGQPRLIKD